MTNHKPDSIFSAAQNILEGKYEYSVKNLEISLKNVAILDSAFKKLTAKVEKEIADELADAKARNGYPDLRRSDSTSHLFTVTKNSMTNFVSSSNALILS